MKLKIYNKTWDLVMKNGTQNFIGTNLRKIFQSDKRDIGIN